MTLDVKIYKGKYKDVSCVILESEELIVKLLPQYGGKIQSIINKSKQKEYLYQTQNKKFKKPKYDMSFADGDCSGFDDMFPTIDKCYYPRSPWQGIEVPDHGEVWSLPWEYEIKGNSIHLSVHGVRFPYKLEKKIKFKNTNSILIEYKVDNCADFDFDFIWAAHPLFNCDENTEIILPESAEKIINVYSESEWLGKYGEIYSWPIAKDNFNIKYDLSSICSITENSCEKYYVLNELQEGWSLLHDIKTGDIITLSYPIKKIPYLGVWVNKGGFLDQYNVALEPCTGAFDGIDTAKQWNRISNVKAKDKYEWFLNIKIGHE